MTITYNKNLVIVFKKYYWVRDEAYCHAELVPVCDTDSDTHIDVPKTFLVNNYVDTNQLNTSKHKWLANEIIKGTNH